MNDETVAKIQFEAEWTMRVESMRANGATMCDSCGCWDEPFGLMPAVTILPTAVTNPEHICFTCNAEALDPLWECFHCGEWDFWSDGEILEDGAREAWACHFCSVHRGDAIWESFLEPTGDRPGAATYADRYSSPGEYAV